MNPFKSFREFQKAVKEFPDESVIEIALANDGKITTQILSYSTTLTINQARWKLNGMNTRGIFKQSYDYKDYTTVFVLKNKQLYENLTQKVKTPVKQEAESAISDSEVIALAVKLSGKLTAAALCVKKDVPLNIAQAKLEELQRKDVFDIELNEKGALVYVLNDYESFKEILP
ncbi:MAG: hypothetical protein KDE26_25475 [Bacteroidetes bacterium]|nr:hypothetical protein [Bacteroidota bacterium]MCB0846635.1 hypothetical protein [Bacteroidota bacterium]